MSEEQLDLQKRQVELMEEILKEIKINNRFLAFLNMYGSGRTTGGTDPEEYDFIEMIRTRPL